MNVDILLNKNKKTEKKKNKRKQKLYMSVPINKKKWDIYNKAWYMTKQSLVTF